MKRIHVLPNLLTLANAFCGLLAMAKSIDALAYTGPEEGVFYAKMASACLLIFLAMVFDALDGRIARLMRSTSAFGAQLDSLADALTFGVAPALMTKVLIEHEGPMLGYDGSSRLNFLLSGTFALMAILRLARFNLEQSGERDDHRVFRGLPSPAAAGSVASTMWLYLSLQRPELETAEGTPTPFGNLIGWLRDSEWLAHGAWIPAVLTLMLPVLGLLMVSRLRYVHVTSLLLGERSTFFALIWLVFAAFLAYYVLVPVLFVCFNGFVILGLVHPLVARRRKRVAPSVPTDPGRRERVAP